MRITDLSSIFRHFVQAQIVDNIPTGGQEEKCVKLFHVINS
jgi:hypothetical protein